MRRFRINELPSPDADVTLELAPSHHLLHVLRQPTGAQILVFDGQGNQAEAELIDVLEGCAVLAIRGQTSSAQPANALHLLVGMPKAGAMDAAVRMATEAGATHIHPVLARRTVATGDRHDRWLRIANAAAQQCGRADVPTVFPVSDMPSALARLSRVDVRILVPGAPPMLRATRAAAVLVGPEGGWTEPEINIALEAGARPCGLGAWVFRTDTACAVAVAAAASEQAG
jgi:16S rRNA (uracil1498-N3)-methyltransferase